ncbi:MAG: hypothetical protein V1742_04710, partial [Pseudomonadota bacterium]
MEEMTSRQRVLMAMKHEAPDRVPLFAFAIDPKFIKAWGGGSMVKTYQALGLDCFPLGVKS